MLSLLLCIFLPFFVFSEDMNYHSTSSPTAICNDGSRGGFYIRKGKSDLWIIQLMGGGFCFDEISCSGRWNNSRSLMSSSGYAKTKKGSGILSSDSNENKHFYSATQVFIPYCSSDSFSGNINK
jgi:hypothetical protein